MARKSGDKLLETEVRKIALGHISVWFGLVSVEFFDSFVLITIAFSICSLYLRTF